MRRHAMRRAVAIGAAACFVLIGAISMAEATPSPAANISAAAWPSSTPIRAANTCTGAAIRRSTPIPAANTCIAVGPAITTTTSTGTPADTAIIPGMASRSIPMAAGAMTSIDAPWPPTVAIGGIATGGAAAFIRGYRPSGLCAAVLRLSCETFAASACAGPHFALKAMEKLTLPGGRRCRKPCAPLQ